MKYIIELEKIKGTNLYKAKGANTLVFDENGISNILAPYEEPEIDWSKVPVDTKVLVRDSKEDDWQNRYFAKYENGRIHTFINGTTSWSCYNGATTLGWNYAMLAEDEE